MSKSRLFSPIQLRANAGLSFGSEQARYVGRVLRLRAGDVLTVFDGSGGEYGATVDTITKQELNLSLGKHVSRSMESPLRIRLVQGISRGERMDIVAQKATVLGAHRISPVLTDFSVVKLEPHRAAKRRQHWQKIAQSACEQCKRNMVPAIEVPGSNLAVLIGPEGGFSEAEVERATMAGLTAVRLGPRIMRTETCDTGCNQHCTGNLG